MIRSSIDATIIYGIISVIRKIQHWFNWITVKAVIVSPNAIDNVLAILVGHEQGKAYIFDDHRYTVSGG